MDKCCGNCDWWDKDGKDFDACRVEFEGFAICLYALTPSSEREKLGAFLDTYPRGGTDDDFKKWHKEFNEAKSQFRVHANDASDYRALVTTRKDHYCSAWEPEK